MNTRKWSSAALVAALLMLGGCGAAAQPPASPLGTWGDSAAGSPNLTFTDDGQVTGTDGCNRLFGEWEQDGDTVSFPTLASTMMLCQDVDTWLSQGTSAVVDGDVLEVRDSDGAAIGTLERQDS